MRTVALIVALLAGCASAPSTSPKIERLAEGAAGPIAPARSKPATLDEVVELSRSGTPPQTIIQILRDSRATYALTAEEGQKLAGRGVSPEVIAYLRGAESRVVRRVPAAYPYYAYPYPYGYYGYPYASAWHPGVGVHFGIGRRW
jgi:hypothetical protein